jgi:NAD(P)H-dependent FMN reductase
MRFAIVSGSHRPQSQSGKVARYVAEQLSTLDASYSTYLLELGKNPLPLWEEGIWNKDPKMLGPWKPVSEAISACDAIVVIAPEWSGMVPAALKNFFLFASDGCLYHKPGLLVGVSASRNGAYAIAELRTSSYKNSHIQYISEHVIVRNVNEVLNEADPASEEDSSLRKRFDYSLRILAEYGKALKVVRASGVLNRKDFPFGM